MGRYRYFAAGWTFTLPHPGVPVGRSRAVAGAGAIYRRLERLRSNTTGPRYRFLEVAERDGWTCHLCGGEVDPYLPRRDRWGATIDHIVPVAHGGGDEPSNVALAHSRCNLKRGTRPAESVRLRVV